MSFFNNSFWGAISAILRMVLVIAVTVISIRLFGDEKYGYIILITTVTGLWIILNSGFYTVLVRRIVFLRADDIYRFDEAVLAGLLYTALSATTFLTLGLYVEDYVLQWIFRRTDSSATAAFHYALTIVVVRIFLLYALALFEGVGNFALAAKIQLFSPAAQIVCLLITFLASNAELDITIYFKILLSSVVIELLLALILIVKRGPFEHIPSANLVHVASHLPSLILESARLQVSNILSMFVDPLNKVLISHFIGVSQVTSYDLVAKIIQAMRGVFSAAFRAFLQLAPDKERAVNKYTEVIRYIFFPSMILHVVVSIVFIVAVDRGVLGIDLDSIYLLLIMVVASILIVFVAPLYSLLIGHGDYRYIVSLHARLAIISAVCTVVLVPLIGLIGSGVGVLAATVYNSYSVYKRFEETFESLDGVWGVLRYNIRAVMFLSFVTLVTGTMLWLYRGRSDVIYFGSALLGMLLLLWRLWKEPLTDSVLRRCKLPG